MNAANATLADAVDANIKGQAAADRIIDQVRSGVAHPDALYTALLDVWGLHGNPGLLGAARRVQKVLERAA